MSPAVARIDDPLTSWEAAASVHNLRETQARVLSLLVKHGAMTDPELIRTWKSEGFPPVSESGIRSRRAELVAAHLVEGGGTKTSPTGRKFTLWQASERSSETSSEFDPADPGAPVPMGTFPPPAPSMEGTQLTIDPNLRGPGRR